MILRPAPEKKDFLGLYGWDVAVGDDAVVVGEKAIAVKGEARRAEAADGADIPASISSSAHSTWRPQ